MTLKSLIRKFIGSNETEAHEKMSHELGSDATVLKKSATSQGVEILAASREYMDHALRTPNARSSPATGPNEAINENPRHSVRDRSTTLPPRCDHADQELQRIRQAMPALLWELVRRISVPMPNRPFPLMHFGQARRVAVLSREQAGSMEDWFFIGDLHGDFFALHTLLRQVETLNPNGRVLFLGDMVDRGAMPIECIFLLLEWGLRYPGRLAWIAGNHDIAFSCDHLGVFSSQVSPAEFLTELNAKDLFAGTRQQIGHFFIDMARRLPRAFLFPDGLLATHGGFPLSDLQTQGQAITEEQSYLDWLSSDACLKDFTWTRINRVPKRLPDRFSSGAQYGFKDFEAFCQLKPQWFPVTHLVTGHEHPANGFDLHLTYRINQAVTLLGMGLDEITGAYNDNLYLGRGVTGAVPEVIAVPVDRHELAMLTGGSPAPAGPLSL